MNFERTGIVSIWIGNFASQDEADAYLHEQYDRDDLPISRFAADFNILWYDHDFLEVYHKHDGDRSLPTMLAGFSFSVSYIDYAVQRAAQLGWVEANTVVLLLDFAYELPGGKPQSVFSFIGSFAYDESAPSVEEPAFD